MGSEALARVESSRQTPEEVASVVVVLLEDAAEGAWVDVGILSPGGLGGGSGGAGGGVACCPFPGGES